MPRLPVGGLRILLGAVLLLQVTGWLPKLHMTVHGD